MPESAPPTRPDADALRLFNRLRREAGQPPLDTPDAAQLDELQDAYPLLLMLCGAQGGAAAGDPGDRLHAWNKAVRRRGWKRLPTVDGSGGDPAEAVERVRRLCALFGTEVAPGDVDPGAAASEAAELAALLERAAALASPPLPSPASYGREHAAILSAYRRARERHPGLPPLD